MNRLSMPTDSHHCIQIKQTSSLAASNVCKQLYTALPCQSKSALCGSNGPQQGQPIRIAIEIVLKNTEDDDRLAWCMKAHARCWTVFVCLSCGRKSVNNVTYWRQNGTTRFVQTQIQIVRTEPIDNIHCWCPPCFGCGVQPIFVPTVWSYSTNQTRFRLAIPRP